MPLVTRIDPRTHSLTCAMLAALERVQPVEAHREGGWALPLNTTPPDGDRARPKAKFWGTISEQLYGYLPPTGGRLQCTNYFPCGGGMEWHTDSGMPGWRVYVFRGEAGSSTFYYRDQAFDEGPFGAYVFATGAGCWHAVESRRDRFSCGVQINETLARELAAVASIC